MIIEITNGICHLKNDINEKCIYNNDYGICQKCRIYSGYTDLHNLFRL